MGAIAYHVAASLDGYIERFDTVFMGRPTYEVGLREGTTSPYPTFRAIGAGLSSLLHGCNPVLSLIVPT